MHLHQGSPSYFDSKFSTTPSLTILFSPLNEWIQINSIRFPKICLKNEHQPTTTSTVSNPTSRHNGCAKANYSSLRPSNSSFHYLVFRQKNFLKFQTDKWTSRDKEKQDTERKATLEGHSAPCQQIGGTVQAHSLSGNLGQPISSESLPFASTPSSVRTYFISPSHFLFSTKRFLVLLSKYKQITEKRKGKYTNIKRDNIRIISKTNSTNTINHTSP